MKTGTPAVMYRKPVSDVTLRLLLDRVASVLGATLHIGDYPLIKSLVLGPGVMFWAEGYSPASKGHYSDVRVKPQ